MSTYAGTRVDHRRRYIGLTVALLAAWVLTQSPAGFLPPTRSGTMARPGADLGRLPLSFEPNAGQTDQAVLFTARAGGSAFYFTQSEVAINISAPRGSAPAPSGSNSDLPEREAPMGTPSSVRLSFVGANPEVQVLAGTQLPGTVNYFLGNDPARWQTNLPTYSGVTYSELYPGIDLHYEGTQRSLKGTYTLAAGADPTAIRWRYAGADAVSVDAQGNLKIEVRGPGLSTLLTEQAPVAWQEINGERIPLQVSYALTANNIVGLALGEYDRKYKLIIDPTLTYSTFLGGSSADYGYAIDVDGQGNVYVTGATGSADFPVVNPIYPPSPNGDVFVTKINPDATAIIYSTFIGGNSSDVGFGIAVDGTGSAYVTGETWSTNFPVVNPFQPENGGLQSDAILLKVNPSGTALDFSTYLGGFGADTARDIAVDGEGSAYITGHTLSSNFPLANPFQSSRHGWQDGFVTKFQPSGQALVFSTYLGGSSDIEYSNSIAVDSNRAVYVAGYTSSTDFPLQNPIQPTNHGFGDTFITKFNPPGTSLAYSTYLGGSDNDIQYSGLAVDPSGNAYVSGYTSSTDFPVVNAYQSIKNGFEDVFVTKINAAGTAWVYSTYLGGIFSDGHYHTDIAADAQGYAYVGGNTASSDFPLVNNIQTGNIDSADDGFVTKFSPSGQELVYSTRLGGNNGGHFYNLDHIYGLALDAGGNVYITGETNSPQYPTTSGVFQPIKSGNYDTFISKISAQGPNTPTPTVTGTPPTATPTPCNAGANYTVTQQSGVSITPGTQDIGNHCESCVTRLVLPFPVRLYDRTFTSALIGNHGSVGFIANQNFSISQCLPPTDPPMFNYAILPFWTEVRTDGYGITCPAGGCGIFTAVTGSPPNRTLHIEWRGSRFSNGNFGYVNFELRLFEGSPNFQVVYGQIYPSWENGATIGAQKDLGSLYSQYACNAPGITPGTALTFSLPDCGPQPTPTNPTLPTNTPGVFATSTATPLVSATSSRTATSTRTVGATATTGSATPTSVNTSTATATACPIQFVDVSPDSTFYPFVRCLKCRHILSGYPDGSFRPNNPMTRGQLSKIVSNSAAFSEPHSDQSFEDVPVGSAFHLFIERLSSRGIIGGYTCGGVGEPCDSQNRPYFRPNANLTRGQTSKIVAMAAGLPDPPLGSQSFEDIPVNHTFYRWIESMALEGIISGYGCGGIGEPCSPPENRPYFRPNANVTRGQASKIVSNTFFRGCATP